MKPATFLFCLCVASCASGVALAEDTRPSIERGRYLVVTGGCNNCHTQGYPEAEGNVPEIEWLKGSTRGFRGPWGTTYPANVRLYLIPMKEVEWVNYARNIKLRPPMPWYDIRQMSDDDLRSIHKFVMSLPGEPGKPAPFFVPPGNDPGGEYLSFPGAR
jgi:mono/diheme cytochrome c family protein